MKIITVGPAYPYRGGIAAFNERLARALQKEGHQVTLHTFSLQYPSFLFPGKSQYSEEPPPEDLHIIRSVNSINPFNWWRVGNQIRKERPDLVIFKFWLPLMGPSLGTIARLIKKNNHSKIIGIFHNIIPHEKRPGDVAFTRYFINAMDGMMAMAKSLVKDFDQFDTLKPRIFSPHPLYDNFGEITSQEKARKKLNLDPEYKHVLFFGLIRDYKGLDLLIKAFAEDRIQKEKIKLIIAGEYYTDKTPYQELISRFQLENKVIQVDKFIPDSEVGDYFNACDLVVQPYKSATQSGVTQIAYHFNKPMIVTDVGGLAEMCPDGKVGYVVQPDPTEITTAILKYFHNTNTEVMTENIQKEKKKYSWNILTANILKMAGELK